MPSGLVSPRLSYSDGGDSNLELESRPGEIYSPRSREEEQVFSMDEQCRSRGRMVSVKWCASCGGRRTGSLAIRSRGTEGEGASASKKRRSGGSQKSRWPKSSGEGQNRPPSSSQDASCKRGISPIGSGNSVNT